MSNLRLVWKTDGNCYFAPFLAVTSFNKFGGWDWTFSIRDTPITWGSAKTPEDAMIAAENALFDVQADLNAAIAAAKGETS